MIEYICIRHLPRIPSSRYVHDIYAASRHDRERGEKESVNNPVVSQRDATAGWIVEEARRRCLYRSKAPRGSAPSRPRPGCLCLPRVNGDGALLESTVIRRRGSLLMRILATGSRSKPTSEMWKGMIASSHKKYFDIINIY